MQNKRLDLTPFFNLYEQQNSEPLPSEARRFLCKFAEQAVKFQNWGVWDKRSGFDPLSHEEVLRHAETYLTGPASVYTGTLKDFSEHLARALTGFYMCGYEAEDTHLEKENEATCLDQAETM